MASISAVRICWFSSKTLDFNSNVVSTSDSSFSLASLPAFVSASSDLASADSAARLPFVTTFSSRSAWSAAIVSLKCSSVIEKACAAFISCFSVSPDCSLNSSSNFFSMSRTPVDWNSYPATAGAPPGPPAPPSPRRARRSCRNAPRTRGMPGVVLASCWTSASACALS